MLVCRAKQINFVARITLFCFCLTQQSMFCASFANSDKTKCILLNVDKRLTLLQSHGCWFGAFGGINFIFTTFLLSKVSTVVCHRVLSLLFTASFDSFIIHFRITGVRLSGRFELAKFVFNIQVVINRRVNEFQQLPTSKR